MLFLLILPELASSYSPTLVALSVVVAALASYVALVLASRVIAAAGRLRLAWLVAGAVAMGTGIWAMHFVGMLAFQLDDRPITYDALHLVLSILVAIAASGFALWVVSLGAGTWRPLALGAMAMGGAIAGMHYLGMAGLHTAATLTWRPGLVLASIAVAVVASGTALGLAAWFKSDESARTQLRRRMAAVVMGCAIAGMHYTAMAAVRFHPLPTGMEAPAEGRVEAAGVVATVGLAILVLVAAVLILGVALAGSVADRYLRRLAAEHRRVRESEAALRRSEDRVRAVEGQLLQAQKLEAVGRLAGGIAHDFNNLLTVIQGTTDLAQRSLPLDHALQQDLATIHGATDRAAALTRQLLAFSRRQTLRPVVLEINTVVAGLESLLRRTLGDDVELRIVLAPHAGRVRADPGQLEQVLLNLAVNARDAMPEGGTLTIETVAVSLEGEYASSHLGVDPGAYSMLSVSDTGSGMDAVTQAQIFEPFFTTKEPGKGTGLGLSTVYGIVKQSGGSIFVYSEPGHGASFKIYLPRVSEPATGEETPRAAAPPPKPGREVILLAEDALDVRRFTARVLREAGYEVLEADGVEAGLTLARLHSGPIHLVLTDVMMPGGTGRDLVDRIRHIRPAIAAVFMSGYTDDTVLQRAVIEPGTAFLPKPFSPALLLAQIRAVLEVEAVRAKPRPA